MIRRPSILILLFLIGLFLAGCPKRPPAPAPPVERPPFVNPIDKVLEIFSFAETLQSKASIRIDMVRDGEKIPFLLNGFVLYQRPDKLRILGYHPLGMGLFDALYRNGEFSLLIPLQKIAFAGEVSEFEDAMRKVGEIQVTSGMNEMRNIPNRIRINIVKKEFEVDLRLKETQVNQELPEDAFHWNLPEGVQERSLSRLLRGIK
ncbi:MAG: hypothetical protein A2157_13340 [Deltaproteobacteria bacterium RBG_16_47_11]|nr:MAG: hypothetical protein A2157_13340 [Deltaproteobacteria bacterium RBG_16_47_11]